MIINPTFHKDDSGEDLYTRLLKDRIVLVFNEVNDELAASVTAQLLYLEKEDPKADITMYICSPGGSVSAGWGIYDTMQHISCDVSTVCVGMCASMGAFLLAGGTKGKRCCTENGQIMIHQVLGGLSGPATDIEIEAAHTMAIKDRLNRILAKNTGHTFEETERDTDRNNWMFADEALAYGIIDKVILDEE